jgi:hypothetical protein
MRLEDMPSFEEYLLNLVANPFPVPTDPISIQIVSRQQSGTVQRAPLHDAGTLRLRAVLSASLVATVFAGCGGIGLDSAVAKRVPSNFVRLKAVKRDRTDSGLFYDISVASLARRYRTRRRLRSMRRI